MYRKTSSGILFPLLFSSLLIFAFNIEPLKITVTNEVGGTPASRSEGVDQFKIVNVTFVVRDYDGSALKEAEVLAFSEDWGIRSPDWFGLTDSAGRYVFEIPVGNWSFFAGGGSRYTWSDPGEAYFATRRFVPITDDSELVIQPDDTITINAYDINSQSMDTEIRMMDSDHVPIIVTPTCGKLNNGKITIHVTRGINYDVLLYTPCDAQPAYVFHEKNVPSGSTLEVRPTLSTVTPLIIEAYDTGNNPTDGLVVDINYHKFSVGTSTGLQTVSFSVDETAAIYATPELVRIGFTFYKNNWRYCFVVNDYNLTEDTQVGLKFGGPLTVKMKVLRENTQIWLDVRDSFGNIMGSFGNPSGEAPIPIKLTRKGAMIFEGDISEKVGSWNALVAGKLDITYDSADSPDFEVSLDLGFFGFFSLTGTLLADENTLHYEKTETEHFIITYPDGFSDRFNVMALLFESAYDAESQALNVELTRKTNITFFINHIAAGFAYPNGIGMGIGFSLDSSYNIVPSTFIGVATHELGHVFQLSPPLDNSYITFWFGEPFATLLGHEAIRQVLGWKFDLHEQGGHNHFFEYLKGEQSLDLSENVQFVLFYLRRTYGMEIHRDFVQLWANKTLSARRSNLLRAGFDLNETIVTFYSYLSGGNLAWLFNMAGLNVSASRIAEGIAICNAEYVIPLNWAGLEWDIIGGSWMLVDERLSQTSTGEVSWAFAGDTSWRDYDLEIDVKFVSGLPEASIGFRSRDKNNLYYFCLAGGAERLTIAKIIDGVETYNVQWTAWSDPQYDTWYHVKIEIRGDRIKAYLDGSLIFDYSSPDMPNLGRVGLRTFYTHASFSNLTISSTSLGTDINGDGKVNILDIAVAANAFSSKIGEPRYRVEADLDKNGIINILDITIVAKDFGKTV